MSRQQQLIPRLASTSLTCSNLRWSSRASPPRYRHFSTKTNSARGGISLHGAYSTCDLRGSNLPRRNWSTSILALAAGALKGGMKKEIRPQLLCSSFRAANQQWTTSLRSSIEEQLRSLRHEWARLLPMCSLFFFMAFINTLMNNLALSLVMTSTDGGAVVIPFLNVYGVLPASLLFTLCYAYASHHMSRDKLFNVVIVSFAAAVFGFTFVLYPHHTSLHLHGFSEALKQVLPSGLAGGIAMIRNWTFALFYCVSELWGDVGLSLLFWGFANDITHIDSAPLLYPLFGIGANLAQILGGIVLRLYSSVPFAVSFKAMTIQMIACMAVVIFLHCWIAERSKKNTRATDNGRIPSNSSRRLLRLHGSHASFTDKLDGNLNNGHVMQASWRSWKNTPTAPENEKNKKSFKESLRTLSECPQIRCLAVMTVAQGLSITLMEFLWKYHLRLVYPTPEAFTGFLGDVSTATGAITGILMCISPLLFRHMTWGDVASITPRILTGGGVVFFGACLAYNLFSHLHRTALVHHMTSPIVFGGALLYVLSRGSKFSLFKPAEEMVYLTLDDERRTKGKAAVDVVGTQIGKSGGSILQQLLLMISGGRLLTITPIMVGMYFYVLTFWQKAVVEIALHRQFADVSYESSDGSEETVDTHPFDFDVMSQTKKNTVALT